VAAIAGLDSSGPNYEFIGIVIGESCKLKAVYRTVKGRWRRIHLRELSRKGRNRIARNFLSELSKYREEIHAISARTGVNEALMRARRLALFTPKSKIRRVCLKSLARLILYTLEEYAVREIWCDSELREIMGFTGVSVNVGQYPVELADIVAWLDFNVKRKRWTLRRKHFGPIKILDLSERLNSLVLKEIK